MSDVEPGVVFENNAMPVKVLMYKADIVDYFLDDNGVIEAVTLVERWGKSRRRRARTRDLLPENKEDPPDSGYGCKTRGTIVLDGTVFEVKERTDRSHWWTEKVLWGVANE